MLELKGAERYYGETVALHPTDLAIAEGKTTALIGPSGCGKSTMLRLMAGLITPTAGSVLFNGRPVTPETVHAIRRKIGYVVQEGGLFPHMTAAHNVTLVARHLGWDPGPINARLNNLLQLVGMTSDHLARYPSRLSGGQRQRVSLMRALFLDPDVLLLDEPLGALDPMIRYDLQEELRAIFRKLQKTVIVVTHDMAEAAFLGDTIVLLKSGRVVQHSTMGDMLALPANPFVTAFLRAQRAVPQPEIV